jgi:OOP family OmpA-OmpF porin
MRKLLFLSMLIGLALTSFSQSLNELLGDRPKHILTKLDRNVNSYYDDVKPIITPDGLRLYYYITNHPENHDGKDGSQDIWYSERESLTSPWKEKVHLGHPFNHHQYNAVLSVLDNGNSLLLKGGKSRGNMSTFSLVRKEGGSWGHLNELEVKDLDKMNKGKFFGGFMSDDEKVLFIYMSEVKDQINSDIYVSFQEQGFQYSRPKKLGKPINTFQDEFGPFLSHDNSTLYFSSGVPGGSGGIDIYKSKRKDDTYLKWSEPENMGEPINTRGFDAYFSVDATGENMFTTRAYKSADGGSLDILSFVPRDPVFFIRGRVLDKDSKEPIQAYLNYSNSNIKAKLLSVDIDGKYLIETEEEDKYVLNANLDGYHPNSKELLIEGVKNDTIFELDIYLKKKAAVIELTGLTSKMGTFDPITAQVSILKDGKQVKKLKTDEEFGEYDVNLPGPGKYLFNVSAEGFLATSDSLIVEETGEDQMLNKNFELTELQVGTTVRLDNIYFDFDKTTLRPESFPELEKLVDMMNTNENLEIEISGHTDDKGSDDYNQKLSQGRAEAVREYVVEQGIDGNRISAVGYGESKPETSNDTEEGRQINRRVEFTVLKADF